MSGETLTPKQEYEAFRESERKWLSALVKTGVFNDVHTGLLTDVYNEMLKEPGTFKTGLSGFISRTFADGISAERIGPNVRVKNVNIYVARILAGPGGLNVVFSPGDPAFLEVQSFYEKACGKLGVEEFPLPFGIFWSDAYFFRGNEYFRGIVNPEEDAGWEVYENWEVTWNTIQAGHPAFFKLGAPWLPPGYVAGDKFKPVIKVEDQGEMSTTEKEIPIDEKDDVTKRLRRSHSARRGKGKISEVDLEELKFRDFREPQGAEWPPKLRVGLPEGRRVLKIPPNYSDGPSWDSYMDID